MRIVSLFSGAGGLDLGFSQAGFDIVWANEFDKDIWETYQKNHPTTFLDMRSITDISSHEVPSCEGIIGGPPCQSWSEAGAKRGIDDNRGRLFFDFIRLLSVKQPLFFLAENVAGMLQPRHREALHNIKQHFQEAGKGYTLYIKLLNAKHFQVPQDRKRVFFIGFRNDLDVSFSFPTALPEVVTLRDAIGSLSLSPVPVKNGVQKFDLFSGVPNHEYMEGGFSSIYMSRNRVRDWDSVSYTIQAGARHAPLHPQAPKMPRIAPDQHVFVPGYEHLYRRLSVRECARIQTFPDDFIFYYNHIAAGYKMVGNAVPVRLAYHLALAIRKALETQVSFSSFFQRNNAFCVIQ